MGSLYIAQEDKSLDKELKAIKHTDGKPLLKLHEKFSNLDVNAKGFDFNNSLKEIEEAVKLYPLDDKLKTLKIELEHKQANKTYRSTKN
jgi:hypothetical protein